MNPALTGIRGIAALWVFFFHYDMTHSFAIFDRGFLGVDIFFVLSGFVLAHANSKKLPLTRHALLTFYKRRALRIFPLHLITLGLVVLAVAFFPGFVELRPQGFYGWPTLAYSIFLAQTWTIFSANWNGPAWSLSGEWLAYLFFPFLLATFSKIDQQKRTVLLGAILAFGVLFFFVTGNKQMAHAGQTGCLRMAIGFSTGMLCYGIRLRNTRLFIFISAIILISSLTFTRFQPLFLLAIPLFMVLAASGNNLISYFFSLRPVVVLGEVSFSLYLVQWVVLDLCAALIQDYFTRGVMELLLTIAATLLAYHYIEKPSVRWSKAIRIPAQEPLLGPVVGEAPP